MNNSHCLKVTYNSDLTKLNWVLNSWFWLRRSSMIFSSRLFRKAMGQLAVFEWRPFRSGFAWLPSPLQFLVWQPFCCLFCSFRTKLPHCRITWSCFFLLPFSLRKYLNLVRKTLFCFWNDEMVAWARLSCACNSCSLTVIRGSLNLIITIVECK